MDAIRACKVIGQMKTDAAIYGAIEHLVDSLVRKDYNKGETCDLLEKQALKIANDLVNIIQSTLPDQRNISHRGYQIAAQASLARLRSAQGRYRARKQWEHIIPSWSDIAQAVRDIPNTADKALVMAWAGEKMYGSEAILGHELLEEAINCIYEIPNVIDRADRFYAVARAWKQVDDKESAKMFLKEAMTVLEAWQWDRTRDKVTGQILQLAHSLDPEFASSLTSSVDNPIIRHGLQQNLIIHDLNRRPEKVGKQTGIEDPYVIGQAAWRLVESFCSGRGYTQLEEVVGQWVRLAVDGEFDDAYKVIAWSIENTIMQTRERAAPALTDVYLGLLDSLNLIHNVGSVLLSNEEKLRRVSGLLSPMSPGLNLFYAGEQFSAKVALQQWLAEKVQSYVRIYDAYFTAANLSILKHINPEVRVDVFTLWKSQGVPFGNRDIQRHYQDAWSDISDQSPPEVHIHIVGVRSTGDGPIHDRYVITQGAGLHLGPSINGLGVKDTSIHILDSYEAAEVESKFITPLLTGSQRQFKGERFEVLTFTL